MTRVCPFACCEEPVERRGMCTRHAAERYPAPDANETWRTTPYVDRPASGDPHALATHASRRRAVDDVFSGVPFRAPGRVARDPMVELYRVTPPPLGAEWAGFRMCDGCVREVERVPTAGGVAPVMPSGATWSGHRVSEKEERRYRAAYGVIRERCYREHWAGPDSARCV